MVTEERDSKPAAMNAFELISLSRGLNLSGLFETRGQVSNQPTPIRNVFTPSFRQEPEIRWRSGCASSLKNLNVSNGYLEIQN
jgi:hypothetical protein